MSGPRWRMIARMAAVVAAISAGAQHRAVAQAAARPSGRTPEALAAAVMRTFASGTAEEFAAIYPDSAGRVFMREARGTRTTELANVVASTPKHAILLLGGVVRSGSAAPRGASAGSNETNAARHFSGFYEAVPSNGGWTLARQIPFDSANFIRAQHIDVTVAPADGIDVTDTLDVSVGATWGFGVRLNNAARLKSVTVGGKVVEHVFGGGVLWVKAPPRGPSRLALSYSLAASRAGGGRSGDTATGPPEFGAYNNTDVWHPFFDYLSQNELAQIDITVRIPAEYYLTTTIPQTDTVLDGVRVVHGRSLHNEFALALIFDRDWRPQTTDFGSFRFESFTGPTFRHSHDSLAAATKRVYDVLQPRFGEPQFPSRYLAAVQDRAIGPGGFTVRMNNAAISGASGGGSLGSSQSQTFAHETGHSWTMNGTGRASNFLHEAWASFVEGLMLERYYGHDDAVTFWESARTSYMVGADRAGFGGGFDGQQSILANYDNGRIHYRKGVWILIAGSYVMGESAFNRGMRIFVDGMGKGPSGYEELIAAWSKAEGHSMKSFVMPWLTSKYIPDVDARVEGKRVIVTQTQPGELFDLPKLEIELTTASGAVRKTIHLAHRSDTLAIGGIGGVTDVRVDPDHHFLVQRHWGEPVVRFEIPASTPALAGATGVSLNGNFLRSPMPATKSGDSWVVELPMTEGRYTWLWQPTGGGGSNPNTGTDPALTGVKIVAPRQRISGAYPGR